MGGAGWGVTDLVLFELLVGGLHVDALRNLRLLHRRLLLFVQLLDVRLIVPQQRLHAQVPQVSVPRCGVCTVRQRVLLSRYKNN